jgi:hypothetical protein
VPGCVDDGCVVVVEPEFARRPGSTGGWPCPIPWPVTGAGPAMDTTPVSMIVTSRIYFLLPAALRSAAACVCAVSASVSALACGSSA